MIESIEVRELLCFLFYLDVLNKVLLLQRKHSKCMYAKFLNFPCFILKNWLHACMHFACFFCTSHEGNTKSPDPSTGQNWNKIKIGKLVELSHRHSLPKPNRSKNREDLLWAKTDSNGNLEDHKKNITCCFREKLYLGPREDWLVISTAAYFILILNQVSKCVHFWHKRLSQHLLCQRSF